MARRSRALGRSETGSAQRYRFPWHKHAEISPGNWSVIGDMSVTVGPPLETCTIAGCPGPKSKE